MKGALHHIEIYVKDLNRSKDFWGWLLHELGYKEYQSWSQGISYILENTYEDPDRMKVEITAE